MLANSQLAQAGTKSAQSDFGSLENLARFAITSDPAYLGRPRFRIANNRVLYDVSPVPADDILNSRDPLAIPLECLIRLEALKRDFLLAVPKEVFWRAPLRNLQIQLRSYMLHSRADTPNGSTDQLEAAIRREWQSLSTRVEKYAFQQGLDVQTSREPAPGFKVAVKIVPPNGRVRYMPFLAYEKAVTMKTSLDEQWRELLAGAVTLIGRYRYRADWMDPIHMEEGNFEIREATDLTFQNRANTR